MHGQQYIKIYLVHVRALISLFHITPPPLNAHIANTTVLTLCYSDMFQPSEGHLQRLQQLHFSSDVNKICQKAKQKQKQAEACNTDTTPTQPQQISQHTSNQEQDDQCGNSAEQSQAPDDGYINVRNMLST